jgi:geranylgeranyl diphosphate synthase type I
MFKNNLLLEYKNSIDLELKNILEKQLNAISKIDKNIGNILLYLKDFNLRGGKRIRGILTIIGYTLFKPYNKEIVKAAVAVELMESFFLIHDDITDNDELRRGSLTLHKQYENLYAGQGISFALVAGDLLCSLGNELIANLNFNQEQKIKILQIYNQAIAKTCYGQIYDILLENKKIITESEISRLHELKTAHYTIEAPLKIGAVLADAKDKDLRLIEKISIPLGKAFQLKDDVLGIFGTKSKLGKSPLSDMKQGKRTLLILKALQKADKSKKKYLLKHIGNKQLTNNDLNKIRKIIIKTGSLNYSLNIIGNLVDDAKTIIKKSNFNQKSKKLLLDIANYIALRSY